MSVSHEIMQLVEQTPLVDTHEHLLEESTRLNPEANPPNKEGVALKDFAVLFSHYADSDLLSAGMPKDDWDRFFLPDTDLAEKWQLVAPYYERAHNTAYMRNIRESLKALYGELDICEDNYEAISERIAADIKPGYYQRILKDICNIDHCQVHTLEKPYFRETAQPELLCQDINFGSCMNPGALGRETGVEIGNLNDWHAAIDKLFEIYGPRANAVKSGRAYCRRIDYQQVSADDAAPLADKLLSKGGTAEAPEWRPLEDHLFHYCVRKATECGLPVKLHTGYYAGTGYMPLHRVRHNAGDMCELCMAHPDTTFDFFHITYPYQDEAITVAKHFPNAHVDMCWAWIMCPTASVRFLKEFLMAAPANKIFTFGGDYMPVELVPGHARIARQGIAQAVTELVEEGWLDSSDVESLVRRIMYGNAREVFDYEGNLAHWEAAGAAK